MVKADRNAHSRIVNLGSFEQRKSVLFVIVVYQMQKRLGLQECQLVMLNPNHAKICVA